MFLLVIHNYFNERIKKNICRQYSLYSNLRIVIRSTRISWRSYIIWVNSIKSFKIDPETKRFRGFGFVKYADNETAKSAIRNLNCFEL